MRLNFRRLKTYISPLTTNIKGNFMATSPQEMMKKWRLDHHHEVTETFADSMGPTYFDGNTLRLEFAVLRMEEPLPPAQPSGTRHVVSRMVLSANCAVELINQMQQIAAQLAQAGVLKVGQPGNPNQPPKH
jgi:hypothetical protein